MTNNKIIIEFQILYVHSTSTLTEVPIQQSSEEKEDKRLGVRASQRISKSRLRQLDNNGNEAEEGAVGMAYDVEQERLM